MKKLAILLLALSMTLAFGGMVSAQDAVYAIYELPTDDLPDLYDSSLEDWEDVLPGTSLTHDDFAPLAVGDGAGIDPADLAYRMYMAWNSADQRLYLCVERVDDVYINTYEGGDPAQMWQFDGAEFMVDGDHTGGSYNGFSVDEYGEEQAKLLTGFQAQQYTFLPESPDGWLVGNNTAAQGWVGNLPWAEAGGYAEGEAPTTSVIEAAVTAWDGLNWQGPELSERSVLEAGKVIGFQISIPDFDTAPAAYHSFHTLSGLASTWREADNFVQGELLGCDYGDCGAAPITAVQSESWGRIKASL